MKSEFRDGDTLGTQILETHEKHLKSDPIECGDFINEFGKKYMSDLFDYIEKGAKHFDKFYIEILSRKTKLFMHRAIELFPYIIPTLPPMQENSDVWFVDCRKQKFELLWTLPERSEFDIILANPCKENKELREWISIFKKGTEKKCLTIPR